MRAWRATDDGALVFVRVTPGADRNAVGAVRKGPGEEGRLQVRVTAPPDRGRANRAVIETLAAALGLPKSTLRVAAGAKDRLKTILVSGDAAAIAKKLDGLIDSPAREKSSTEQS